MKIMINQKEVSQERIEQWRKHRILKAAKMLNLQLPNTDNTEILDQALLEAKMKLTYEELIQKIGTKLKWSQYFMKWATKMVQETTKKSCCNDFCKWTDCRFFQYNARKVDVRKDKCS